MAVSPDTDQIVKHQSEAKRAGKEGDNRIVVKRKLLSSFLTDSSFSFSATFSRLFLLLYNVGCTLAAFAARVSCFSATVTASAAKGSINSWN